MLAESSAELSRKQYFWVQLALLVTGIVGLRLSYEVAAWDAAADNATIWTAALVSASLIVVVRSNYVIVTSAFSDAYRVFRFRHLLASSALLGAAAVVTGSLVVDGPFGQLFAHGRITGKDIADLGSVVATFVCSFGAACASAGTWTAFREERHWDQSLHLRGHRPT